MVIATSEVSLGQSTSPSSATLLSSEAQGDRLEKLAREKGDVLIPTCRFEGGRCGYIDRAGNTVVAPQFDWVERLIDNRALVGKDGKYGAIDDTGKLVIPTTYKRMSHFEHDLALVLVGDRLGMIDQNGQWIVPAEYGRIVQISNDRFLVAEPPCDDTREGWYFNLVRTDTLTHGKRWGIVTRGGTWIVRPKFAQVDMFSDDFDGLFWASDSNRTGAQWQLMRADGTPVNDNLFDHVQRVSRGEDRAVVARGREGNRLWGAVNGKGEIVVELKFDWLGYFRNGWAPYKLAGREGRIDRDGNILSDMALQPKNADPYANLAAVVDGKYLYTDKTGTKLLGIDHPRCPDGRHLSFKDGLWKIMTADERPAPDIAFQYVSLKCSGPSIVQHDGKWGFITTDSKLLANRYFDGAHSFYDGIAVVTDNKLTAIIDEDGNYLLGPLKLERRLSTLGTGAYVIQLDNGRESKKLDKALVAELARDPEALTRPLTPKLRMSEGLAALLDEKLGKWGFVDASGRFVIAPRFDAVSSFTNGTAWAAFPDRREWCQIDKAGQIRAQASCRCNQPIIILEDYHRPAGADCYDDGLRIIRDFHYLQ